MVNPDDLLRLSEIYDLRAERESGWLVLTRRLPCALQDSHGVIYDCVGVVRDLINATESTIREAAHRVDQATATLGPVAPGNAPHPQLRAILNADSVGGVE